MRWTRDILNLIVSSSEKGEKLIAVLLDPDKMQADDCKRVATACEQQGADLIFAGGSLITQPFSENSFVRVLKENTSLPVILFPGSPMQIDPQADAILLLSLISGRNPELLIGHHVTAAPYLAKSKLEILSTGYILIDGGVSTTVQYISGTQPVPSNKPEIAATTALAGEMLGNQLIYLDAGSGAITPVPEETIAAVKKAVRTPVIVGGGIRNANDCRKAFAAGADVVVLGTIVENYPETLQEITSVKKEFGRLPENKLNS